jgi:hypothetical protein
VNDAGARRPLPEPDIVFGAGMPLSFGVGLADARSGRAFAVATAGIVTVLIGLSLGAWEWWRDRDLPVSEEDRERERAWYDAVPPILVAPLLLWAFAPGGVEDRERTTVAGVAVVSACALVVRLGTRYHRRRRRP